MFVFFLCMDGWMLKMVGLRLLFVGLVHIVHSQVEIKENYTEKSYFCFRWECKRRAKTMMMMNLFVKKYNKQRKRIGFLCMLKYPSLSLSVSLFVCWALMEEKTWMWEIVKVNNPFTCFVYIYPFFHTKGSSLF